MNEYTSNDQEKINWGKSILQTMTPYLKKQKENGTATIAVLGFKAMKPEWKCQSPKCCITL